jgi:hypothetical protein
MPLYITRIKPNPAGKDRGPHGQTSAAQLAAEWVDFQNNGSAGIDLANVELYHRAYHPGQQPTWEQVTPFSGVLPVGKTVRVHSGCGPDSAIRAEDRNGADYHVFSRKNYIWNNKEGDTPALYNKATEVTLDSASYDPNPPEGQILVRSGAKLMATQPSYSGRTR